MAAVSRSIADPIRPAAASSRCWSSGPASVVPQQGDRDHRRCVELLRSSQPPLVVPTPVVQLVADDVVCIAELVQQRGLAAVLAGGPARDFLIGVAVGAATRHSWAGW